MRPDSFDISLFDRHPAFRVKRAHRRKLPRNPNVWPLPSLDGCQPLIIGTREDGVSIAYDSTAEIPGLVPVFSVSDGVVKYAGKSSRGHTLVLDHGDGHRSFYDGIDHPFVLPTSRHLTEQRLKAGDVLGYVRATSLSIAPLHLEIGRLDGHWLYAPVDVERLLRRWLVLPWSEERDTPPTNVQPIAA